MSADYIEYVLASPKQINPEQLDLELGVPCTIETVGGLATKVRVFFKQVRGLPGDPDYRTFEVTITLPELQAAVDAHVGG